MRVDERADRANRRHCLGGKEHMPETTDRSVLRDASGRTMDAYERDGSTRLNAGKALFAGLDVTGCATVKDVASDTASRADKGAGRSDLRRRKQLHVNAADRLEETSPSLQ